MTDGAYIKAYLARIGIQERPDLSPESLRLLQRKHLFSVVFENLELLEPGFVPDLSRDHLYDKFVSRRRGGICYELNTSFYQLLRALGFSAVQISGRSVPGTPMTGHVFTLVHLPDGDYTADVGFGNCAVPVMKLGGGPVRDYGGEFRLEEGEDGLIRLYRKPPAGDEDFQYEFLLTPRTPEECLDAFRTTAAPGNTFFSERLICCRYTPEGKMSIRRGIFSAEENGRVISSRPAGTGEELNRILREDFGIRPDGGS
ncbi:MAG: arylamine N-acetyltransferase [Oscillospiraceae bacterium]|nr:arylamine N-acetyltransferase [Oscillospiraceae bacterium]